MYFKWYNPKRRTPKISIANYGITISNNTLSYICNHDDNYFSIGLDEDTKQIAITKTNPDNELAIKASIGKSYKRLNCKKFINYLNTIGFNFTKTATRYICIIENNIIITQSIIKNNKKGSKK